MVPPYWGRRLNFITGSKSGILMTYRLLNLACGSKVSRQGEWTNVDFESPEDQVIEMNILRGLKFSNASFDVVYSAQFIEHLTLDEAEHVLKDVARVMKPGGIIRLVTPDLEELTRAYLTLLDQLKAKSDPIVNGRYDWIKLEIFDQIVRDCSGGDWQRFLATCNKDTRNFIIARLGYSVSAMLAPQEVARQRLTLDALLRKFHRIPRRVWKMMTNLFATDSMRVGRFRRSGEVHRYMHDIYSLSRTLEEAGFHSIQRVDALKSEIPNWERYELDVVGGEVDGPLCLYVEARR
jgi:predicted SAM-dependent methyltransferase